MKAFCRGILVVVFLLGPARLVQAGTFLFAGEANGVNLITHPTGYTGGGGTLTVGVCIDDTSANASEMILPVQNIVATFNRRQAVAPNLFSSSNNDIGSSEIDFESVALHEVGHCIGLGHVNAASESGLSGNDKNYTKATDGVDNTFNLNDGADNIIGSADDIRGDDANLHWFRKTTNNPCAVDNATSDGTTYSRDLADLPAGETFAANADRDVCADLGSPNTEAVMQQGTSSDEDQRALTQDGVSTLELAMSGLDETAGTADDYTLNLVSHGVVSNPAADPNCDIVLAISGSGLASCSVGGAFIGGTDHIRITTANIVFGTGFNWFFNTGICSGAPQTTGTNLNLSNTSISDAERFRATQTITAGTNFAVTATGCVNFSAGQSIRLEPGFSAAAGSRLRLSIDP